MRTRDGHDIDAWKCLKCARWWLFKSCPICDAKPAREAEKTAIAPDPQADTGENQNSAKHRSLGSESDIQAQVEAWLRSHGYWPRSPKFLTGDRPPRGWYVHVHQARGNPIMLDLLVLDEARGHCEIELKTATGRIRADQQAILDASPDHAVLCRSAQDAIDAIRQRFEMA